MPLPRAREEPQMGVRKTRFPGIARGRGTSSFSARSCSWTMASIEEHWLSEWISGER